MAAAILHWTRTHLVEYLATILWLGSFVVLLGISQDIRTVIPVALLGGTCVSAVVACGFFIRWRRWIGSLAASVTTGDE